ncbi:MAG TPA: BTAD domain-containing putative transcriptional regulator, partial [Gaiellaceae bacterium]|nr:BTAD domain-containing putative transcriptional regulator [Gaiellaceae bacterium]
MPTPDIDFRILGPLEARRDGVELSPGGPKQRALLALLLLHANERVSHSALIDGLWGEQPPETAAKALQVYVSQLRRTVGRELVHTRPGGYQLVIAPDALDLLRFEQLVADARAAAPAAAAPKLREALALWRGSALADVADAAFAQEQMGRLEELRLAATEQLVDAELALATDSELVPELERLVAQNPLRERLRAQLMLALYRSGRQADALDCYQEARRLFVDELGIEPGRQLRELHGAILRQDAALDLEPPHEASGQTRAPGEETPPEPDSLLRGARKTVTVLHVALTTTSQQEGPLDPEALQRVTSRALGAVRTAVERHGGTVETASGEAISAVFGLPTVHEDDALRAVRSAAELRERLELLTAEVEGERRARIVFRAGVSTGEVVTGGEAGGGPRTTGVPLAASAQLGHSAGAREIVLDELTLRLVRELVVVEQVDEAEPSFRLLHVQDTRSCEPSRLASPMVGREGELGRLRDAFEQAVRDRSCQLFTILGTAGVGKSRLVREFLGELDDRALVARGRCLPYGEGITFWPLLEAVKEAASLDDSDSPDEALGALIRALGRDSGAERSARRVAEMIGLAPIAPAPEDGSASVLALFGALARRRPV